jgi:L-aspartate semialdehyde sulfurtransferase ferredoxin
VRSQRVKLTFPESLIREPIISTMARRFDVTTNIRRADVRETTGWVVLELTGAEDDLEDARAYLDEIGVRVDDLESYVE